MNRVMSVLLMCALANLGFAGNKNHGLVGETVEETGKVVEGTGKVAGTVVKDTGKAAGNVVKGTTDAVGKVLKDI